MFILLTTYIPEEPKAAVNTVMPTVDTVFCSPSICMPNPKNPKISFSLYGAMRTSRVMWRNSFWLQSTRNAFFSQKCPWLALGLTEDQTRSKFPQNNIFHSFTQTWASQRFLATLTKFDPKSILGEPKNPNFDSVARTAWNQCHCEDHRILVPTTIHGSKSKLERPKYHKNGDDVLIVASQTSESHNFWSDCWIFEFHTFLEAENEDLSKGVKISLIRGSLRPATLEWPLPWKTRLGL